MPGTAAPGEPPEEPPALIANRYRLLARIHASSAGTLYRAEDLAFSRSVALRVLTPALSRDEAVLARLQARLHAGAAMNRDDLGADIVELTDLGRADNGLIFVVTEFLASDSLATQLTREGPLPWRTLRPLMVRACQIIHLSHQHGLLRLDLQTRHFFPVRDKTRTSTLKILSTGIGDVFDDNLWSSLSPAGAAAHLHYAAPEQVIGGPVDARTDVYALGVIMYELLAGRVPFPDARPAYLCARHLLEPAPLLTTGTSGPIPEAVAVIVARALAKAPDDRWPTMRALANAMAAIEFGPCDASGVLEVVDVHPLAPAASSASMRIDPTSRHAPSPAVRPKTMPPLRDAFLAEPAPEPRSPPVPEDSLSTSSAEAPIVVSPVPSARPESHGSSSSMAWAEILAAADEAIASVAEIITTGTAGDSGVFIPESLLRSGAAATTSMIRGRLSTGPIVDLAPADPDPASSHTDTVVLPRTLLLRADAAAASTTLQLEESDLGDIADPGDSASDTERAGSLRAVVERSAAWPIAARSRVTPRPRRSFAWAAALLLMLGGVAVGVRMLRPLISVSAPIAAASLAPPPNVTALPAAIARPRDLSPRPDQSPRDDLSDETASPGTRDVTDRQWPQRADDPLPALLPGGEPSSSPALAPVRDDPPTTTIAALVPGPAAPRPVAELTPTAAATAPVERSPTVVAPARATQNMSPETSAAPPPAPRKSSPGAHLPDAGHELAAPLNHDPIRAASLLTRAEQAAGRGEQGLALSLAIQSYHAQPSTNALVVAGKQACKLGDGEQARWARLHLAPGERGLVDAACNAAGLALE